MTTSIQPQGQSLLAVIIVLTMMILPTVISVSDASLRSVPLVYKEASLGLGANHLQTIFKVMLPSARSGIIAGIILGVGRAIGETMAIILVAGNPSGGFPFSIFDQVRPLTTNIALELSYAQGLHQEMIFATALILFIFIMILNATIQRITRVKEDK